MVDFFFFFKNLREHARLLGKQGSSKSNSSLISSCLHSTKSIDWIFGDQSIVPPLHLPQGELLLANLFTAFLTLVSTYLSYSCTTQVHKSCRTVRHHRLICSQLWQLHFVHQGLHFLKLFRICAHVGITHTCTFCCGY